MLSGQTQTTFFLKKIMCIPLCQSEEPPPREFLRFEDIEDLIMHIASAWTDVHKATQYTVHLHYIKELLSKVQNDQLKSIRSVVSF